MKIADFMKSTKSTKFAKFANPRISVVSVVFRGFLCETKNHLPKKVIPIFFIFLSFYSIKISQRSSPDLRLYDIKTCSHSCCLNFINVCCSSFDWIKFRPTLLFWEDHLFIKILWSS